MKPVVRTKAFSLLELIVTLALISIMVGFFAYHFATTEVDSDLDKFQRELEQLVVKTARSADAFGEDRIISFQKEKLVSGDLELEIPDEVTVEVKRGDKTTFRNVVGTLEWLFQARGMVEPLTIRLRSKDRTVDIQFDPLTARPVRSE